MSETVLSILGYVMIIGMMYLLLKGKASPIVVFLTLPVAIAFVICLFVDLTPLKAVAKNNDAGNAIIDQILIIASYIKEGVGKTTANAVLFSFSIPFFGIMNNLKVFDGIVNKLIKISGNNIALVLVATAAIATIAHLDGSAASTVLITIPAMLPIYKRLKIRPEVLLLIIASSVGFMNLVPWGGPTARVAVVTGIDGNIIWRELIPVQVIAVVSILALSFILAMREKAYISSKGFENLNYDNYGSDQSSKATQKAVLELSKGKIAFNISLTVVVVAVLVWGKLPLYLPFMVGMAIALLVNYKGLKAQEAAIKEHSAATILVVITMLASGVFVGIFENSGLLPAMSKSLIYIIPDSMARYLHIIMGVLSFPIGMVLGTDTFFYGLYPLVAEVGTKFGISVLTMGKAMLIGKNFAVLCSPLVPAIYLMLALGGVDLKEHIKFSFFWLFMLTLICIIGAVILGVLPLTETQTVVLETQIL